MEMGDRMTRLETIVANIKEDTTEIKKDFKEFKTEVCAKIDHNESKFAPAHIEAIVATHGKRLDKVESKIYYFTGVLAIIVVIVQIILAVYL